MSGSQFIALLKKNQLSSICALLSVFLAIALFYRSDALTLAEADLAEKTALSERYATNISYSSQLKEQYDAVVLANQDIKTRFVRVSQLAQNLQYFYKLEAETHVKMTVNQLTQQGPATNATKQILMPVAFSVSVQGDYPAVLEFLRRVENGAHFSRVQSCTLGATGIAGVDSGQARSVTLALNLELLGLP